MSFISLPLSMVLCGVKLHKMFWPLFCPILFTIPGSLCLTQAGSGTVFE